MSDEIVKQIKDIVDKYPNNMELGKNLRSFFWKLEEEPTYIYESPDGGTTVYKREFGNYKNRQKVDNNE